MSTILMLLLLAEFAPSPSVFSLCTHSESLILLRFQVGSMISLYFKSQT